MNLQQGLQPKSSANGYGRRRVEREMNTKLDNKFQSGKSNSSRSTNAGIQAENKTFVYDNPSRDRLVYMTTCLIGHHVEVQLKNGSIYCGIFHATDAEKDFGIILKMARMTKDGSLPGQKFISETIINAPSKTLIIPAKELVQVVAKDVSVTRDGLSNELQREKQQEILLDSFISQSRYVEAERALERWVPDEDNPQCPELENIFDGQWNRSWDQFETNETLFGVKSTFNEELYTTKLERGPQMRDLEKEAVRIAREIEGEETHDLHLAEERGRNLHENYDVDEETRFSSVFRGTNTDDSGYEEHGDLIVDSHNTETFGGSSFSAFNSHFADVTGQKSNDRAGVLSSSSSLDEAQLSQSSIAGDLYRSSSYDQARQLASERPVRNFPASDGDNRIHENFLGELDGSSNSRGLVEMQMQAEDVQFSKSEDSLSKKDGINKGGLSPDATAYAPSNVSSKGQGKPTSSSGHSEAPSSGSVNSRGRPSGSTSSVLDRAGAAAISSGPGLSPSSSRGSLSSEKSALNPHAKEFKLNPNAKSFIPSQNPVRPPSPASDGSYFPNASGVPQLHGMPLGIGIGPSFVGHQPVVFNPQVVPLQSPQPYLHPNGPQFGQQMLLGHHRPVLYMPGYPPEMQYKGRDF